LTGTPDVATVLAALNDRPQMTREQREEWERQDRERMRRYAERQRLVRPGSQLTHDT
jgi:hypothetical protein